MKTTLELDDQLLIQAKTMAIKRRTTLKALVEHALRREIESELSSSYGILKEEGLETGPYGLPRLKREAQSPVTSKDIYRIMEEENL